MKILIAVSMAASALVCACSSTAATTPATLACSALDLSIAGSWQDGSGDVLTLNADGTFAETTVMPATAVSGSFQACNGQIALTAVSRASDAPYTYGTGTYVPGAAVVVNGDSYGPFQATDDAGP